jgi:HAD superfamily hydrolase (TIGR01549 family)
LNDSNASAPTSLSASAEGTIRFQAVVFDAFGTLLRFGEARHPYRRLQKVLNALGRGYDANDRYIMMENNLGLAGFASEVGYEVPANLLADLERDLFHELANIRLYEDVIPTLDALRASGLKIGVCSNLAAPYGLPIRFLLPDLDCYALSYEVGAVKPSREIYRHCTDQLGVSADAILFVGDTPEADVDGPIAFGMSAVLLDRENRFGNRTLLKSLQNLYTLIGRGQSATELPAAP